MCIKRIRSNSEIILNSVMRVNLFQVFCIIIWWSIVGSWSQNVMEPEPVISFVFPEKWNRAVSYFGTYEEEDGNMRVTVEPEIRVRISTASLTRSLCGFEFQHNATNPFPFSLKVMPSSVNSTRAPTSTYWESTAEIRFQSYEYSKLITEWSFYITAFDCDVPLRHISSRILVILKKKMPPRVDLRIEFPVAKVGSTVGSLRGAAGPGCLYYTNPSMNDDMSPPFSVSPDGTVRNNLPLNSKDEFYFSAVAKNCTNAPNGKEIPVEVVVRVERPCQSGWIHNYEEEEIPTLVESSEFGWSPLFAASVPLDCGGSLSEPEREFTVAQPLQQSPRCDTPKPKLRMCHATGTSVSSASMSPSSLVSNGIPEIMSVEEVTVRVSLENAALPTTEECAVHAEALRKQRQVCSTSDMSFDLLQHENQPFVLNGSNMVQRLPSNITESLKSGTPLLPDQGSQKWTFSFWLQRNATLAKEPRRQDEHILCQSGSEVYLWECSLAVRLASREKVALRFQGPKVKEALCPRSQSNSHWHHFTLVWNQSNEPGKSVLNLYLDGEVMAPAKEISIESSSVATTAISSTVTLGGCLSEGGSGRNYLRGSLSGVWFLRGDVESAETIRCLATCGERLRLLRPRQDTSSVVDTVSWKEIVLRGPSEEAVSSWLNGIQYSNTSKERFTNRMDSNRKISITTTVKCKGGCRNGGAIERRQTRIIELRGYFDGTRVQFAVGSLTKALRATGTPMDVTFLNDIFYTGVTEERKVIPAEIAMRDLETEPWDSCLVKVVDGSLSLGVETMTWSEETAASNGITVESNDRGLLLVNVQPTMNYVRLLKTINFHSEASPPRNRTFLLTCSQRQGLFVSDDIFVTVAFLPVGSTVKVDPPHVPVHARGDDVTKILSEERHKQTENPIDPEKPTKKVLPTYIYVVAAVFLVGAVGVSAIGLAIARWGSNWKIWRRSKAKDEPNSFQLEEGPYRPLMIEEEAEPPRVEESLLMAQTV